VVFWYTLLIFLGLPPAGAELLSRPEIGLHYRVLTFEKNVNPQNNLIIFARLSQDCRFDPKQPPLDMYWLMNHKRFKPSHPMIKSTLRRKFAITPESGGHKLEVKPVEAPEIKKELRDPRFEVTAMREAGGCAVSTVFSDGNGTIIHVDKVYGETKSSFLPPFQRLVSFTVSGTGATGAPVSKTYKIAN
jgi:hypothetical protein